LRDIFCALRYIVRCGCQWRMMPRDLPPWQVVYQQAQRWMVERSFGWAARFKRLSRDYERLASTHAGFRHVFARRPLPKKFNNRL
jgi:transposase